jgi:hypothetical protein
VAAANGHTRVVMMLVLHGADKKARNALNETALYKAREGINNRKMMCQTYGIPYDEVDGQLCLQYLK